MENEIGKGLQMKAAIPAFHSCLSFVAGVSCKDSNQNLESCGKRFQDTKCELLLRILNILQNLIKCWLIDHFFIV